MTQYELLLNCLFQSKMFKFAMNNKAFTEINSNIDTPNDVHSTEKALKSGSIKSNRVDINILKSKLQETESKELKKNMFILSVLILCLGILGIYLSL